MPVQNISLPHPLPAPAPATSVRATHACPPACLTGFAPGSLVRTLVGEQRVDSLLAGDTLIDADGRLVVLRGRQMRRVARADLVRIMPGALDPMARLDRDLVVGAAQGIVHEDWRTRLLGGGPVAVAAWRLVDDMLITRETRCNTVLWSLILDRPTVLRVNGLRMAVQATSAASGSAADRRRLAA